MTIWQLTNSLVTIFLVIKLTQLLLANNNAIMYHITLGSHTEKNLLLSDTYWTKCKSMVTIYMKPNTKIVRGLGHRAGPICMYMKCNGHLILLPYFRKSITTINYYKIHINIIKDWQIKVPRVSFYQKFTICCIWNYSANNRSVYVCMHLLINTTIIRFGDDIHTYYFRQT